MYYILSLLQLQEAGVSSLLHGGQDRFLQGNDRMGHDRACAYTEIGPAVATVPRLTLALVIFLQQPLFTAFGTERRCPGRSPSFLYEPGFGRLFVGKHGHEVQETQPFTKILAGSFLGYGNSSFNYYFVLRNIWEFQHADLGM